ncbi:c-type cytochrome [Halomonas mongoliensis]|uniref:c-type cytochrome n=1 Tax=Halomonas mongoliensis TaxID=321265 RepID=UPI00403AF4BD
MSAFVSPKRPLRPLRHLPLILLAALALAGPLHAHDDSKESQASAPHHGAHAHAPAPASDHGDHAHAPAPANDHGDHAHGHGDHAHGDHGRQAPQEWLDRESPLVPSADNLAFGQQVYQRYCAACHGERGRGDGVAAGVAGFVPVPTDLAQHGAGHAAGEYAWLVKAGNPESAMPRFAGKLGEEETWAVVLYIRHVLAAGEADDEAGGHRH